MGRLWSSGFELNSLTAGVEFNSIAGGGGTIQTTTVRSGTYALQITSLTSATTKGVGHTYNSPESTGNFYFRAYLRVATFPSAENRIMLLDDTILAPFSTPMTYLTLDNVGTIKLYDEDGQITGTTTIASGNWYCVEFHVNTTPAAGSHVVEARVDGSTFASLSNRNIVSTNQHLILVLGGNLNAEAQTTGNWYFDDIAINNSAGSVQNSWPGPGKIVYLRPNGDGDNHAWQTPSFVAGTANNYLNADEVTPDDITTYLQAPGVAPAIDDYQIDNTPAAIGATDSISVVQVGVRYRAGGAGTGDGFAVRVKKTSGGTVSESATITPANATWVTNANSPPRTYPLTLYADPDGTPWTKSTLDTAQIGINEKNTTGAFEADVTAIWMVVDFTPAVVGGFTSYPKFFQFM